MKRTLVVLLQCFVFFLANAQQSFNIANLHQSTLIKNGIYFIEDKDGKLNFEQAKNAQNYEPVVTGAPNFGMSKSAYWLKIVLHNSSQKPSYRLQVAQPALDQISFFYLAEDNRYQELKSGEELPFSSRQFFDPSFIYSLKIPADSTKIFYLRIQSRDNLQVPILIGTPEQIFESNKTKDYVMGLFGGIMLVMLLYNLFLFVTVRDKTYLYYVIYLFTVILTQTSIQGYTFQFLWPNCPAMAQWSPFIWSPAVGIASGYFIRIFLTTKTLTPWFDKGYKIFNGVYLVAVVLSFFGFFTYSYLLITACASGVSMYMLVNAFVVFRLNYRPARYFLVAWFLFLTGVTVYAMTNFGFLPVTNFTQYAMPAGAAAEVVLLSLALADRINVLKREKEESQAEALRVSEQNQRLITEQNIILEQKVHERTVELEETNEELSVTLTYLKDTQAQLVNAEKMASLGQLTAGIAHEINNPINFVSANLKPLRLDISEVFELIHQYDDLSGADNQADKLAQIEKFKKKIDLPFLKHEIDKLLRGIEDGASRTAEIVSGLRNFSRLDESDFKEANINEGVESTLVLLRSQLDNIEVVTNLGELPSIECYPGKLNQVFMNIFSNAIYAINKNTASPKKQLSISTYLKAEKVYVEIEDTGIGMSQEVIDKIFEPFFTTKDVGEGTGLGMSIVFKIIESHHAKLEISSVPGQGTKMTIILNQKLAH